MNSRNEDLCSSDTAQLTALYYKHLIYVAPPLHLAWKVCEDVWAGYIDGSETGRTKGTQCTLDT